MSASASRLLLLAPMRLEARALRRGAPNARIITTGMGPRRSLRATASSGAPQGSGLAVAGLAGALAPDLTPGQVVVASELRTRDGTVVKRCPGAGIIAGMLARRGIDAHVGPIVSVRAPVAGTRARAALRDTGALAVDMESAYLAQAATGERPFVTIRVVLDTPQAELWRPRALATALPKALRALTTTAATLSEWADAIASRELILAGPRASCAGVERAIEIVERTLDRYGPPVYMRKQIVHNRHVVSELERRGAVCVDELDQVPDRATVVFSAHGVSPKVRQEAERRELNVIDGTCPLVRKVHAEARRFAQDGYTIVLVGHEGHEEVDGTAGEAPDHVRVIAGEHEVDALEVANGDRIAYLTQTTLAVDETRGVVERLKQRFPDIAGPRADDICYATQNRQDAVRALAQRSDLVLVVGSQNSSNSNRLVEVARRSGTEAALVDAVEHIDPAVIAKARRIGVTAGASSPERLVQGVVDALAVLGPLKTSEHIVAQEAVNFALPPELRG